jgi:hypothetical protein
MERAGSARGVGAIVKDESVRACRAEEEGEKRARKRRGLVERFWTGLGGVRGRFSRSGVRFLGSLFFVFFLLPLLSLLQL